MLLDDCFENPLPYISGSQTWGSNDDLPGVTESWAVPEARTTLPAFLRLLRRAVSGAGGHPAGLFLEHTTALSASSQPAIQFTA